MVQAGATLITSCGGGRIYTSTTRATSSSSSSRIHFNRNQFPTTIPRNLISGNSFSFKHSLPTHRHPLALFRVEAGWIFNRGGDQNQNQNQNQQQPQGLDLTSEHNENANEDILIFFFQLDLATRVQCALNMDQFEIAQQLRNKLAEVEAEVTRQRDRKRGPSAKTQAQDNAISILRLRAELQNAIESENYAVAAEIRDGISKLETESLSTSAKALVYEQTQYAFRLGQKVRHKAFGYRGVISGMDPVCGESSSWMEDAQVEKLPRGSSQPFYQVLVDVHADPNLLVAYVAEDNLLSPEQPDLEQFDHPYVSFMFYGIDSAGDFIPIRQLREKYNRPRHEVPNSEDENEDQDK